MCSSARVGVDEDAEACSFINTGRPGALLGSSVAQWHLERAVGRRFRGCRAKRFYVHIGHFKTPPLPIQKTWLAARRRARTSRSAGDIFFPTGCSSTNTSAAVRLRRGHTKRCRKHTKYPRRSTEQDKGNGAA